MPRPCKPRTVRRTPPADVFKPAGIPARNLQWIRITLDEFEALRLVDAEGLDQAETGERMRISRPTVSRILGTARTKVARALSEGQALAIEGGPVIHRMPCSHRHRVDPDTPKGDLPS